MKKETVKMQIWGIVIVPLMIIVFKNLYSLTNGALLGIFFGSVNDSMWEQTKIVMLSYLIWSLVEAVGKRSGFHRFAVSRIISIWFVGAFCLLSYLLIYALGIENANLPRFICAVAVCLCAFVLSAKLEYSDKKLEPLFLPCVFLMLLLVAVYCSFTVFPPHMVIFEDTAMGMYGIIPEYIDSGAIALDTVYRV